MYHFASVIIKYFSAIKTFHLGFFFPKFNFIVDYGIILL